MFIPPERRQIKAKNGPKTCKILLLWQQRFEFLPLFIRDKLFLLGHLLRPVLLKNSNLFNFNGLCKLTAERLSMNSMGIFGSKQGIVLENLAHD